MKREWAGIKQEPIAAINALNAGTIKNDKAHKDCRDASISPSSFRPACGRQAQARLQGCRVFGEFNGSVFGELSRAVVERRLEQAAEEFRKWGREGQRRPDFVGAGLCGLPEG